MTYKLKYDIFHNVQTEAQAYCLGCFYFHTDGRIQLSTKNAEILSIISKIIEYNGPLRNYNKMVELNISQKNFLQTLNFEQAILPSIPNILMSHFIRSIFDLYGTISITKGRYLNISIIQEENFIQSLREYLFNTLNIPTKHYYRYSHTNTVQMMITTTSYAKKFLNWMYQDANYYLTRKRVKYQKYLENGV